MKTIARFVRRYITAAFAIVLLIFTVSLALFVGTLIHFGSHNQNVQMFKIGRFAESFILDAQGNPVPGENVEPQVYGFAWSMMLSDGGDVIWRYNLPPELDHPYTTGQVAAFSRWYLADYPVFVYRNDYGLLVSGMPKGSLVRFNMYMMSNILHALLQGIIPLLLLDGLLIIGACLWLSWRAARGVRDISHGIQALAQGECVSLPVHGAMAELCEALNKTSERLTRQNEIIASRDNARTQWIAGVSHDIRTPLSLIFLHAEKLAHDTALSEPQRLRARQIGMQGERIRALIEDLNLTSKLQYDAQPLRLGDVPVGEFLRRQAADFCNGAHADACELDLHISEQAEHAVLVGDRALLERAIQNLLINSVRHNANGSRIAIRAGLLSRRALTITVADDGRGYPLSVLCRLAGEAPDASPQEAERLQPPHILGLHLVRQIAGAHDGEAAFSNDGGAVCVLSFAPLTPDEGCQRFGKRV